MRLMVAGSVVLALACRSSQGHADLGVGDRVPVELGVDESVHLMFVTTFEDCFSCRIQGGYVALRSTQLPDADRPPVPITALLITRDEADTLAFGHALADERIVARIRVVTPRQAAKVFDLSRIPAIYLLAGGHVMREWEAGGPVLGRNDISVAVGETVAADAGE
jgi:hypothetical protein